MARAGQLLFVVGVIVVALAFAAHVGHAVLLANGRRALPPCWSPRRSRPSPGWSPARSSSGPRPPTPVGAAGVRPPAPVARRATSSVASWCSSASLVAAGDRRRPRTVGQHVRVHGRVRRSRSSAGYLLLERRYPIRPIGFIPFGVALALLLYASRLPSDVKPLVPALQYAPLLTIHVGMAVISYGIFATASRPGSATSSRARATGSPGCRRTRRSTRSPTAR